MFYVDKYGFYCTNPDLLFHKDIIDLLEVMSRDDSVPHLIFYGPEGAGKKLIIHRFLEMLYGPTVHKITATDYEVVGSGNNKTTCTIRQSKFHIVIEPNNTNFDRYMIHDIVKEYAQRAPRGFINAKRSFKTVLINNIDNLSYYAQTSLRRTMEKYSKSCRFIMWSESLSKVIDPLRSRCFCFRVTPPTRNDIIKTLYIASGDEGLELEHEEIMKIVGASNGSLKTALWLLELYQHTGDVVPFFRKVVKRLVDRILIARLEGVNQMRSILYQMMITNIPESKIIIMITDELLDRDLPNEVLEKIVDKAEKYEHRLVLSRRQIFQLDAFIVSVMNAVRTGGKN